MQAHTCIFNFFKIITYYIPHSFKKCTIQWVVPPHIFRVLQPLPQAILEHFQYLKIKLHTH